MQHNGTGRDAEEEEDKIPFKLTGVISQNLFLLLRYDDV